MVNAYASCITRERSTEYQPKDGPTYPLTIPLWILHNKKLVCVSHELFGDVKPFGGKKLNFKSIGDAFDVSFRTQKWSSNNNNELNMIVMIKQ